ncbi:MAG: type II toxin-antitoxin system VapC family toxin [Chloroflexota bacterium]
MAGSDTTFIDTGAFYGLADRGDRSHPQAVRVMQRLRGADLVSTNLVLAETWFLARSRRGRNAAMRLWQEIREGAARIEVIQPEDLARAWEIAQAFADQDFSLTDCTSFAFIERYGIHRAFSFDRDFAIFRYGPRRNRALEVLGLQER